MSGVVFMSGSIKDIVKVASIYMATIIGAGFASGQEIVQFFTAYEKGGFYGILLAGILFSVIGCLVLDKVYRGRIRNYNEFIYPLLGMKTGRFVEAAATVFMFCLFCIMIAGAGNILYTKLGISYLVSVFIMAFLCMFFMSGSIKGIAALSTAVTPVLIIGILATGIYVVIFRDISTFSFTGILKGLRYNWFASAILYVGYNSIMSIMLMSGMLVYLKSEKTARLGGALGGLMLCFAALVLYAALFLNNSARSDAELPFLQLVTKYDIMMGILYSGLLWLAMFLSAATSGYCFVDRVCERTGNSRFLITAVICAAAIPLSTVGFSKLIAYIYPVFGYLGLFISFAVLLQGAGERISRKKSMK